MCCKSLGAIQKSKRESIANKGLATLHDSTQLHCWVVPSLSVWPGATTSVVAFSTTVELSLRSWEDKDIRLDCRRGLPVSVYHFCIVSYYRK